MTVVANRLDLRFSAEDKSRIRCSAASRGMPMAAVVREAVLREADAVIVQPSRVRPRSLSARVRGRATVHLVGDQVMSLTRGQ